MSSEPSGDIDVRPCLPEGRSERWDIDEALGYLSDKGRVPETCRFRLLKGHKGVRRVLSPMTRCSGFEVTMRHNRHQWPGGAHRGGRMPSSSARSASRSRSAARSRSADGKITVWRDTFDWASGSRQRRDRRFRLYAFRRVTIPLGMKMAMRKAGTGRGPRPPDPPAAAGGSERQWSRRPPCWSSS